MVDQYKTGKKVILYKRIVTYIILIIETIKTPVVKWHIGIDVVDLPHSVLDCQIERPNHLGFNYLPRICMSNMKQWSKNVRV